MSGPILWKKQFSDNDVGNSNLSSPNSKSNPIGIQKRRKSSLQSLYSPYTRRRSFLSRAMLENETLQCYKIPTYSLLGSNDENIPTFSISLSESQGFIWNQDLFASKLQQSEAGVDSKYSMSNDLDDDNNYAHHSVEVIDVVLTNDDYNSDVEITTEIVKVGIEGEEEEEDDDDDDHDNDDGHNDENDVEIHDNNLNSSTKVNTQNKTDTDTSNNVAKDNDDDILIAEL